MDFFGIRIANHFPDTKVTTKLSNHLKDWTAKTAKNLSTSLSLPTVEAAYLWVRIQTHAQQ